MLSDSRRTQKAQGLVDDGKHFERTHAAHVVGEEYEGVRLILWHKGALRVVLVEKELEHTYDKLFLLRMGSDDPHTLDTLSIHAGHGRRHAKIRTGSLGKPKRISMALSRICACSARPRTWQQSSAAAILVRPNVTPRPRLIIPSYPQSASAAVPKILRTANNQLSIPNGGLAAYLFSCLPTRAA
jgi:hypothetical protein